MRRCAILTFFALLSSAANAESPKPSAPAGPATPAPSTSAPLAQTTASPNAGQAPALSQSKFLGLLYVEIARHTPARNALGQGDVAASFHVNAQGKVDKVVINKSSSAAHADLVKQILAVVNAPPPPGGGAEITQNFKFH